MKSTLTIAVAFALLGLFAPETALAGKKKKTAECHGDIACAQGVGYLRQSNGRLASRSGKGGASSSVGWSCRFKKDGYDEYRRVQNKSSRKSADTFLGTATTNFLVSAFSASVSGNPIGLVVGLVNSGMQYENLTTQQKIACEKLELEITNKKKQMVAIAEIGKKMSGQIQQVALNLKNQIADQKDPIAQEAAQKAYQLMKEDFKNAGFDIDKMIEENSVPPSPQAKPEEKPATPKEVPVAPQAPEVPSVSAPVPKLVVPPPEAVPPRAKILNPSTPLQSAAKN